MTFLPDFLRIDWRRDLVTPLAIAVLPALILITLDMETSMIGVILAMIVMGVMSALAGYRIAPRVLWLAFSVAFLLTWASFGIADRVGAMGDGEPYDIAPWFVGVMILVPMIVVAFVPLWTGRLFKRDNLRIAERRKAAIESH